MYNKSIIEGSYQMAGNAPKQKIKDSVFTDLFQDKKYLLLLYQTLHPEDSDVTEDDLQDVTLKHILVDADYNDLGFSVGREPINVDTKHHYPCIDVSDTNLP